MRWHANRHPEIKRALAFLVLRLVQQIQNHELLAVVSARAARFPSFSSHRMVRFFLDIEFKIYNCKNNSRMRGERD